MKVYDKIPEGEQYVILEQDDGTLNTACSWVAHCSMSCCGCLADLNEKEMTHSEAREWWEKQD